MEECMEKNRISCILHRNKSRYENVDGVEGIKTVIEFEEDKCPSLATCKLKAGECRCKSSGISIEYERNGEILNECPVNPEEFVYPTAEELETPLNVGSAFWGENEETNSESS